MQHQDTAQAIADVANKAQYTGSAIAAFFSFINDYAAAIGALVAIVGFCINWWYRHKLFKLEKAKFAKEGVVEAEE